MGRVVLGELLDGGLNGLHAPRLPHDLGGVVGVRPRAVPVSGDGFGIEADHDPELLRHPMEDVPGHPEIVPHIDPLGGPHLELPLGRHHLGVLPADPDAGVEAGPVVRLHDVPAEHAARPHPAVVWTLGPGEPALGPAQRVT